GPGGGVRFALTSEAGLNDGLAFPFTWLAIGLALNGGMGGPWTWDWLLMDVVWRLAAGAGIGYGVGRLLGWLVFGRDDRAVLSATRDGFVAVGVTFISYAAAELVHGYGFIAVFVAAVVLRRAERDHEGDYVVHLHHFIEQIERLLMMVLLVLFGGSVVGGLLDALTWTGAAAALLLVFLVRPLAGMVALVPTRQYRREAMVTAFFGIRGVGSFYYLAFAAGHAEFPELAAVWSVVGFTVLLSVVVHGIASTPVMRWLDRTLYEPEADRRRAARQTE
ncbi:MAG: cation:proton antiporter, partial [Caenispirillum sp.]|nr:cation:proton antiporter [Caenispirillum sp.]